LLLHLQKININQDSLLHMSDVEKTKGSENQASSSPDIIIASVKPLSYAQAMKQAKEQAAIEANAAGTARYEQYIRNKRFANARINKTLVYIN
jgi:hypothetical protein